MLTFELDSKFSQIDNKFSEMQKKLTEVVEKQQKMTGAVVDNKLEEMQKKLLNFEEQQKKMLFSEVVKQQNTVSNTEDQKSVIENSAKEIQDRESRKDNLVWFGIPESASEEAEVRKQDDLTFVSQLGEKVFGFKDPEVFKKARRLGQKGDKPRPLLTTVDSSVRVSEVLRQAKELGQEKHKEYKQVSVKKDMTPLEREEQRRLVQLRNQKRDESQKNGSGDIWVIRRGKVINVARKQVLEPKEAENAQ